MNGYVWLINFFYSVQKRLLTLWNLWRSNKPIIRRDFKINFCSFCSDNIKIVLCRMLNVRKWSSTLFSGHLQSLTTVCDSMQDDCSINIARLCIPYGKLWEMTSDDFVFDNYGELSILPKTKVPDEPMMK